MVLEAPAMAPVRYLETGKLYCGDNLDVLPELPDECIDLVYLDPPFFSNRNYEVIWGDEAELRSFKDRWQGGIDTYLDWMEPRLRHMHRILKATGSLYLHCDPSASHYLKVMLDEIFGASNFRNEVIWQRSLGKGHATRKFPASHDTLFVYGRTSDAAFHPQFSEPTDEYKARFRYDDEDGRGPYRLAPLDNPSVRPNLMYEYKGFPSPERGWRVERSVMEELDADGRLAFPSKPDGRIGRKHYIREQDGPRLGDVWTDIRPLQRQSAERLGYPTQKPEELLERIISAATSEGDVVLDAFCGCGTTIAAAHRLKREWVGVDISPTAVALMKRRMERFGISVKADGLPVKAADLRHLDPHEFQNWIVGRVLGTHSPRKSRDGGIDGFSFFEQLPIQVKRSDRVGRVTLDSFETAVARAGKHKGYIVAFSFTRDAYAEAARAKRKGGPEIALVTVKDLMEVGELVDSADRQGVLPDLSRVTPDLMGLFSAWQKKAEDRPLIVAPDEKAKPAARDLIPA